MKNLLILSILLIGLSNNLSAQIDFSATVTGRSVFYKVTMKGQFYEGYRWEFGDGYNINVLTVDTITHTYDSLKTYKVCVVGIPMPVSNLDTACKNVSIVSTGLMETEANSLSFSIFPNPATISLRVETSFPHFTTQILDISGRTISTNTDTKELDVSTLPSGIYLLRLQNEQGNVVRRFVKE